MSIFELNPSRFAQATTDLAFKPANVVRVLLDEKVPGWASKAQEHRARRSGPASPRASMARQGSGIPSPTGSGVSLIPQRKASIARQSSASTITGLPPPPLNGAEAHVAYNASTYKDEHVEQEYLTSSMNSNPLDQGLASSSEFTAAMTALKDNGGRVCGVAYEHSLLTHQQQQSTEDTLQWLIKVSRERHSQVWATQFDSVLKTALDLFNDPDESIRELAVKLMRDMIKYQGVHIGQSDALILEKLLERHKVRGACRDRVCQPARRTRRRRCCDWRRRRWVCWWPPSRRCAAATLSRCARSAACHAAHHSRCSPSSTTSKSAAAPRVVH